MSAAEMQAAVAGANPVVPVVAVPEDIAGEAAAGRGEDGLGSALGGTGQQPPPQDPEAAALLPSTASDPEGFVVTAPALDGQLGAGGHGDSFRVPGIAATDGGGGGQPLPSPSKQPPLSAGSRLRLGVYVRFDARVSAILEACRCL